MKRPRTPDVFPCPGNGVASQRRDTGGRYPHVIDGGLFPGRPENAWTTVKPGCAGRGSLSRAPGLCASDPPARYRSSPCRSPATSSLPSRSARATASAWSTTTSCSTPTVASRRHGRGSGRTLPDGATTCRRAGSTHRSGSGGSLHRYLTHPLPANSEPLRRITGQPTVYDEGEHLMVEFHAIRVAGLPLAPRMRT